MLTWRQLCINTNRIFCTTSLATEWKMFRFRFLIIFFCKTLNRSSLEINKCTANWLQTKTEIWEYLPIPLNCMTFWEAEIEPKFFNSIKMDENGCPPHLSTCYHLPPTKWDTNLLLLQQWDYFGRLSLKIVETNLKTIEIALQNGRI